MAKVQIMQRTVSSTEVNVYLDTSVDTEMTLGDGRRVFFAGIAPVPAGHTIRAVGDVRTVAKILRAIHPIISEEGLLERLEGGQDGVYAISIEDVTARVTYRRRVSIAATLTA